MRSSVFVLVVAATLVLTGCAADTPETQPSETQSPQAPWGDDTSPGVFITFTDGDDAQTLSGRFAPDGLLMCDEEQVTVGNKSPAAGLGVTFSREPGQAGVVSGWVVGDERVAQFSGHGEPLAEPGADGTTYTLIDAEGWIMQTPRDPELLQIGEYDMSGQERIDATLSFTVTCPAR